MIQNTQPLDVKLYPDDNQPLPVKLDISDDTIEKLATTGVKTFMQAGAEIANETAKDIAPDLKKAGQTIIGTFLNGENAIRFGYPIALFFVVGVSGFYGARVAWKIIEKNLLSPKPRVLQPGSKYGWYDRWQRKRAKYKTPAMIFDDLVKERLEEIQEKTKNIRNNIRKGRKLTYDNLLLYGKPGTGKTLFAQILADYTDMDFLCVTAASLLQSGVEGIKYFDELLEMAEKSKYGVILFIDEADALFVDRNLLKPDSDHYKVLNHILAATGSGSNKMMMIAATNHAYVMDPAMGRRFQERVKMPLPGEKTREDLLNLYISEYLDETVLGFGQTAHKTRSLIAKQGISEIAQEIAGLSHAEIKDMVIIMAKKAAASVDGVLTEKHIRSSIAEAIEKKAALKRDRAKLKKKNDHNQE
jgi:AAA+ superfamily predicted ATPase